MSGAAKEGPAPLSYAAAPEDHIAAHRKLFAAMRRDVGWIAPNLVPLVVAAVFCALVVVVVTALFPRIPTPYLFLMIAASALALATGGLTQWAVNAWAGTKMLRGLAERAVAQSGDVTVTLEPDAFATRSANGGATRTPWASVTRVERDRDWAFVWVGRDAVFAIPRRAFADEPARAAWIAEVERRIAAARMGAESR